MAHKVRKRGNYATLMSYIYKKFILRLQSIAAGCLLQRPELFEGLSMAYQTVNSSSGLKAFARVFATAFLAASLTGCGTYVPEIQEFPGNSVDSQLLVQAIVRSVHCEIQNAITYVIDQDKKVASLNHGIRSAAWLDNWGVQIGLTLTVEEKTTLNPTGVWTPPNPATALFTLGGGATLSSDAKRIDKLNYYYKVADLYNRKSCIVDASTKSQGTGSLLIQSDLKLRDWLLSQVLGSGTGAITVPTDINSPLKQDALSHEVSFEVVTGGNITPAWKLVHVTVNQGGSLFSANRDRTHDLLIVFGPTDPKTGEFAQSAASTFLASQIGLAVNSRSLAQ